MKNVILGSTPKATFLRLVTEGTAEFKKIWENGTPIKRESEDIDLSGVKGALKDAGVCKDLSLAVIGVLATAIAKAKDSGGSRKPTEKELNKQFLTFVPYAAVVPLRNRNHHKYTIGEPVIMAIGTPGGCTNMYGMDKNGCIGSWGNELPRLRKSLRPATYRELSDLVNRLYS